MTAQATPKDASLARISVGPSAPTRPEPAVFHATLGADPRSLERAFLVYELSGLGHWSEAVRQINGLAVQGGEGADAAREDSREMRQGGLQVEEIAPSWLRSGDNEIRFFPLGSPGSPDYGVGNVRIVGLPHGRVSAARLSDGTSRTAVSFGGPSQVRDVVFDLQRASDGKLFVGAPHQSPIGIPLHGLEAGWHRIELGGETVTSALGVWLDTGKKKAIRAEGDMPTVSDVAVTASPLPAPDRTPGEIVVSYPLHGECIDHQARVRGFVVVADRAEPIAALKVNGQAREDALAPDGSFSAVVPEPQGTAGRSWNVRVEVALASGRTVTRSVPIGSCVDRPKKDDEIVEDEGAPFGEVVHAGEAKTLAFGGTRLEIPAGAVSEDTRITVRPLAPGQVPAMSSTMANLSPDGRAYRFGPHGLKFKKPVKITLPYDPKALPRGIRPQEIYSFFYDEPLKKWSRIGRFSTAANGELVSLTEHFTDFVNATLPQPDEPGTKSFNPNEMSGIKLASPSAGLGLIEPPQANSAGTAELNYGIEVPPGRGGIEPRLAFSYDSGKGNGWLGLGWDLPISMIEVDTRRGVPKYDGSEHYLLDGEELLAPAGEGVAPPAPITFVRRVEGRFDKIQANYDGNSAPCFNSWTVTDKNGTVYTYGDADSNHNQGPAQAVLADPTPTPPNGDPYCRAFRWGLSSVQDTFGNVMKISYFIDAGMFPGSSEPFAELYPRQIDYTSNQSGLSAAYHVAFGLDNAGSRPDIISTGRPGFLELTRYRLDHVDIAYNANTSSISAADIIRRYQVAYAPDSPATLEHFHKSLLASVGLQGLQAKSQLDQHTFAYTAAPTQTVLGQPGINGFGSPGQAGQAWGTVQTSVNVPRTDDGLTRTDDTFGTGGASIGVNIGIFSASASLTGNLGEETQHLAFADINGDGLPDSIDDNGNGSANFLRPALSGPSAAVGHLQYAPIQGLTTIGHTNRTGWTTTGSTGISLFGGGPTVTGSYTNTTTDDDALLADIDGDGFLDVATTNGFALSWSKNNGQNQFGPFVGGSSVLWGDTVLVDADLVSQTSATRHRVDPIIRWVAPYGGEVHIVGGISKPSLGGNGVDVAIYQGSPVIADPSVTLVWDHTFGPNDNTSTCVPSGVGPCASVALGGVTPQNCGCDPSGLTVNVGGGDQLYFVSAPHHESSGPPSQLPLEAVGNRLIWDPQITYNLQSLPNAFTPSLPNLVDPTGEPSYQFDQRNDFRLSGQPRIPWVAMFKGTVQIGSYAAKLTTSDDTELTIEKVAGNTVARPGASPQPLAPSTTICDVKLAAGVTGSNSVCNGATVDVDIGDELFFSIAADTPIDPNRLGWLPQVSYTCVERGTMTTCGAVTCTTNPATGKNACTLAGDPDRQGTIAAEVLTQAPTVFYNPPALLPRDPPQAFVAPPGGPTTVNLTGNATAALYSNLNGARATVLVQGVNALYCKQTISCTAGGTSSDPSCNVNLGQGQDICKDPITLQPGDEVMLTVYAPQNFDGTFHPGQGFDCTVGSLQVNGGPPMCANVWSHDQSYDDASGAFPDQAMQSGGFHGWFFGFYNGDSLPFDKGQITFPFATDPTFNFGTPQQNFGTVGAQRWMGPGGAFIAPGFQSATRAAFASAGDAAGVVPSLRHASTWDLNFGVAFGGSTSFSQGRTSTDRDFFDFNGDRCADSITSDGTVQVGDCTGNFAYQVTAPNVPSPLRLVNHNAATLDVGDPALINVVSGSGDEEKQITAGFQAGLNYGQSTAQADWSDVNGDGLPDAVSRDPSSNDFVVHLNYGYRMGSAVHWAAGAWSHVNVGPGAGSVAAAGLSGSLHLIPNNVLGATAVRTQDSASQSASVGVQGQYGAVNGGAAAGYVYDVTRTLVDLVDVNGDGLPDEVMRVPGEQSGGSGALHVRLNLGESFDSNEVLWSLPLWEQAQDGSDGDASNYSFLDTMDDALEYRRSQTFNASVNVQVCYVICVGVLGSYASGSGWAHTRLEDVDGDGLPDQVFKQRSDPTVYAKLNQVGATNLLSTVHRPLGGTISLTYAREGNLVRHDLTPSVDEPRNKYVLATATVADGRGNQYLRTFDYAASGYEDRVEREEYGFAKVTTTREDQSTVENDYLNQDFYHKRLLAATEVRDASQNLFRGETYVYAGCSTPVKSTVITPSVPISCPNSTTGYPNPATPLTGTYFPSETTETTNWYEGQTTNLALPGESMTKAKSWDSVGNLTELDDYGDVGTNDDVTYKVTYDPTLALAYIYRPKEVTAKDKLGNLLRDRQATYESHGALKTLTNVVIGGKDPTSGTPYTGQTGTNPVWTFNYDNYGNVLSEVDPRQYTLTYVYDAIAQTYRMSTTDSFGYGSASTPNYFYGTVQSVTDENGQPALYNYDEFGRLKTLFGPNDIGASEPTIAFSYSESGASAGTTPVTQPFPAYATTSHKDVQHPGDPIVTATFSDGLDRIIQTKKDLAEDTPTGPVTGMTVSGAIVFDPRGRIQQQGQPVFDTGGPSAFVTVPMTNPTTYSYDILDRNLSVTRPDGALTTVAYGFDVLGGNLRLTSTVKDPNVNAVGATLPGFARESFLDVRGLVLAVKETNRLDGVTPTTLITRYTYDPLEQLALVTDAKGNQTSAQYDSVGRMVGLTSPDAGHTEWRYDLSGNLGAKQTANLAAANQTIKYQYDFNRLKAIVYPTSPSVAYTYGTPSEAGAGFSNVAGRIKKETSEAGTTDYQYDSLGNVSHISWALNSLQNEQFQSQISYSYDSFHRRLTTTFPDGEVVSYGYDAGGNVSSVIGVNTNPSSPGTSLYVSQVGYDQFEERTRLVYGNGIQATYTYDPRTRRLTNVNASELDPELILYHKPARPFQALNYAYDPVGNITQIRNDAPFDDTMQGFVLVGTSAQNFTYDDLYQLKTAEGAYQENTYWRYVYGLGFTYDGISNILKKAQTNDEQVPNAAAPGTWTEYYPIEASTYSATYKYGGSRPHAPTEVDETVAKQPWQRLLAYDADGNQAGWTYQVVQTRKVTWDEEDRIRSVDLNGVQLAAALYNAAGERTDNLQSGGSAYYETTYFGADQTLRDGAFLTKQIFLGDTRIASKMSADWFGPAPPTIYFHDDQLGSTNFLSNDDQELVSHEEYFPSGELWVDETDSRYATVKPYLFNGKELDTATGLYYFGARYYDPHLSIWASPDPILRKLLDQQPHRSITNPRYLSLYTYAFNNPVTMTDPDGRDPYSDAIMAGDYEFARRYMEAKVDATLKIVMIAGALVAFGTFLAAAGDGIAGLGAAVTGRAAPTVAAVGGAANTPKGQEVIREVTDLAAEQGPNIQSEVQAVAPQVQGAVEGAGSVLSQAARLSKFYGALQAAKPAGSADEALDLLSRTLTAVEDAHSGVAAVAEPGLAYTGRMYPPMADFISRLPGGGLEALTKGQRLLFGSNGSIEIFARKTGELIFQKAGR